MIAADGSPEPPDDPMQVVPSTWPGMRAPFAMLDSGGTGRDPCTLDWFGRDWVLCHAGPVPEALVATLGCSLPLRTQALPAAVTSLFERRLVLVRPDGHVAWRGDAPPEDAAALANLVRGA